MPVTVSSLSINDAGVVFDTVLRLLVELGDEADDLGALNRDGVIREWAKAGDRFHVLAARDETGRVVGLLTLSEAFAIYANGAYGIIDEMFVEPEHRSQGVGRLLVDAAKAFGQQRDWARIEVTAPESDRSIRARQFYERAGFTFAGPKLKCIL